ncbi:MAG TPA: glycosyltransferase family 39 protein [Patescibacteria group bacterium]|jgi:4-amino-4-deoxy-L-arabinose transferase-like glycosyltransferase|nr:glycosyltransferase family 39 protein [Patescibacteria group bacterium]
MHKIFLKRLDNFRPSLDKYKASVTLITLLTLVIRFYNFPNRWGIGSDNARDAIIALEALSRHQLPLMGPFSSAGPFVTGGIYYWLVMASYIIFPFSISSPWILTGIISIISVVLLMYLGKILIGKRFSIIIGILAMLSPQYVGKSIELGNPTFVTVFAILTIICFVKVWQKNEIIFSFLMGISIGLAISMHYEAINLLIFALAVLFIPKFSLKKRITTFLVTCLGVFIPSLPILYWDAHQSFANTRNILDYLLIAQYRIYVPNSWKLFLFNYFPVYWGRVVGNFYWVGLALFFASGLTFFLSIFRKRVSLQMFFLGIIFLILLFINKSYRGERTDDYLIYLIPFILIFTAFLIEQFFTFRNKLVKSLGLILLVFLILMNWLTIKNAFIYKNAISSEEMIIKTLNQKYPNQKFSIYDYKHENSGYSLPLSLLLRNAGELDKNGVRIGINCYGKDCPGKRLTILTTPVRIESLSFISPAKLAEDDKKGLWVSVNASSVYDNQVGWLNKDQLKSTFSLKNYIISKL